MIQAQREFRPATWVLKAAMLGLIFSSAPICAQDEHGVTPAEVERGERIYFTNCSNCHGPNGDAVSGVNLGSGKFRKATTDRDLIGIIRNGIPGTAMPPSNYSEEMAGWIVAYLHSMTTAPAGNGPALHGDVSRGKDLSEQQGKCRDCHRIGESGGFLGPDLNAIGMTRRSADLERSLRDPSAEIRPDNRTIRATEKDGTIVTGRLLNQDSYRIQIIQNDGRLRSLTKDELREFEIQKSSPMPSYAGRFSDQQIADVVSYLASLKGNN